MSCFSFLKDFADLYPIKSSVNSMSNRLPEHLPSILNTINGAGLGVGIMSVSKVWRSSPVVKIPVPPSRKARQLKH